MRSEFGRVVFCSLYTPIPLLARPNEKGGGCRSGRKLTGRAKFRGLVGPDFYQIPNFFVQFLH